MFDDKNNSLDVVATALRESRDRAETFRRGRTLPRVPIARCFHSRKSVFLYCVDKVVARLRPTWRGSTRTLRRAVRAILLPRRRNLGFLGRVLQTLHTAAVASILIAAIHTQTAYAHDRSPSFSPAATPSGLSDIGFKTRPDLADLDGDGDLDLIAGDGSGGFVYFKNIGDASAPAFATSTISGLTALSSHSAPALGDLNGDGLLDLLSGEAQGTFHYFLNTGSATAPAFAASTTLSGLTGISNHSNPTLGDLDGDGDLDVLSGHVAGLFIYFENTGSATAPAFAASTTLSGLPAINIRSRPTFGDLDGDGDLDVLAGDAYGNFVYFENTGSATAAAFAASTTLSGLSTIGSYSAPTFGDLDGDGDLDLLSGNDPGTFVYYENEGRAVSVSATKLTSTANPFNGNALGAASATFGDLDGDGDPDMLAGNNSGNFFYFRNTGSASAPAFTSSTLGGLSDVGGFSAPAFGDLDGDGDLDMLAGNNAGAFVYFLNVGSAIAPSFSTVTISGLSTSGGTYSAPVFGDLDGDGDLDVLAGVQGGSFFYFKNVGSATGPFFSTSTISGLTGVAFNSYTNPALGDVDGDGDLDIIAGQGSGTFFYLENTGTATAPAFASSTTLSGFTAVGTYSVPAFGDLDGDGDLDLFSGDDFGTFHYFETELTSVPSFAASTTLSALSAVAARSTPAFGDLDGDGDLDMLAGQQYGDFAYFENTGTPTAPAFAASTTLSGLPSMLNNTIPTLGDLDGDGDLDLLTGHHGGSFIYYENTGTAAVPAFAASTTLSGLSSFIITSVPTFGDLDGDGDLDVLTGFYTGTFTYFQNTGTATVPAFAASTTLSGLSTVGSYSTPALGDVDGDGDLDVISGDASGLFHYFENTGTATVPAFAASTTLSGFSGIGASSAPTLGDLDGDGDLDLLAGQSGGVFVYFKNTTSFTMPSIDEGDRVVVPIIKNASPTSFGLNLNVTEDLNHSLTWSVRLAGGSGAAVASGSGTPKAITYTPNADFVGVDVFIVEVANEHGTVDSATIVVRVFDPANAIPLRDNFVSLDGDSSNGLTLAEARVQIPGLTQLEFDALDTNGNGVLSLSELLTATIGTGSANPVYVNFSNLGTEDGAAPSTGFDTLLEGASFVTSGGTVIISGGSSPETIFIPAPMTLQAGSGTVTIGAP